MSWFFLLMGVGAETLSHVALKSTDGFNKPLPLFIVVMGHLAAFLFLSHAMKGIPVGIDHALWAGLAVLSVTLLSAIVYRQHVDATVWIGMVFVAIGIGMINLSHGH